MNASTELRDPDIVAFIQGQAEVITDLRAQIDELEAGGSLKAKRRAKALRALIAVAEAEIAKARRLEAERDALMGEGRDTLIRAKLRGEEVEVREVERASFALNEHGGRIINRAGPNRGLPALRFERGASLKLLAGVQHAFAMGYLDNPRTKRGGEALKKIGEDYQREYAKTNPLKAVDPSQVGGGGFGPRGPQVAACEAAEWLKIARRGLSDRQVEVLDLICGQGWKVSQVRHERKRGHGATIRALRSGLVQVAKNQREATETGARVVASRLRAGGQIQELRKAI